MLFERMTEIMPEYNELDKMLFIESGEDRIVNYLMQVSLVRNTIYRATYNMLIRVFLILIEKLSK